MKVLAISEIIVRSRQRKTMNRKALDDLKLDIMSRGLLHAPVIRWEGTTPSNATFVPVLVAGERRLTAIKELAAAEISFIYDKQTIPIGCIPCIELEDRGEIANREAELNENILREDLSWQDKVAAVNELHQLRLAQNPAQTKTATGAEVAAATGLSIDRARVVVDRATIVADHLHDPDVARAATAEEAFKIVSRKMEARFTAKLSEHAAAAPSEHTLLVGDMREQLLSVYPTHVCAIFDPPYGIGADSFGDAASLSHSYTDTEEAAKALMAYFFQASDVFLAKAAHVYVFCDLTHFQWLSNQATIWGWTPLRLPLIWTKGSQGHVPDQRVGWRRTYECILFAARGGKPLAHIANDSLLIPPEADKLHAAQKPVALYQHLLSLSCLPGDHVLDPCCGSGTIFKAAHNLRLRATGIELNEQYAEYSRAAINGLKPLAQPIPQPSLTSL